MLHNLFFLWISVCQILLTVTSFSRIQVNGATPWTVLPLFFVLFGLEMTVRG